MQMFVLEKTFWGRLQSQLLDELILRWATGLMGKSGSPGYEKIHEKIWVNVFFFTFFPLEGELFHVELGCLSRDSFSQAERTEWIVYFLEIHCWFRPKLLARGYS